MFLSLLTLFRQLIACIDLTFLTLLLYLIACFPWAHQRPWYKACFRYWCRVFIRALGVSLYQHQHYRHSLPKQYILIANHPSAFEDMGMSALFKVRFLAKIEVKTWFLVGKIGAAAGTLYVHREDKKSRGAALDILEEALLKGDSVGLYPEGGCKGRRVWLPFLFGAFQLSLKTGIPIVPVFLHYEAQETFEWQHQHLLKKLWQIATAQNRQAHYHVFEPIDPKAFHTVESYCQHVQSLYSEWQRRFLE